MNNYKIYTLLICLFFFLSCENKNEDVFSGAFTKGELGVTEIASITSVKDSTATLNCVMSYKGKGYLLARGICWSTTALPTIENGHAEVKDTGIVTLRMSKLTPGTLYYVRPYITNNEGTAYGPELSFTTRSIPTATIASAAANLTAVSASITGTITADGGDSVTVRGVCWGTSTKPTIALTTKTTNGAGKGSFSADITGLVIGTSYYARTYATNVFGTAYSSELIFTTQNTPTLTTTAISNISAVTATSGGAITNDGGSAIIARGVCWSTTQNPTIDLATKTNDGIGIGTFTSTMVNLQISTTYYVRAYATNALGTSYGTQQTFTTNGYATITTNAVSAITSSTATCGGNISSGGGTAVTARGVCWSTSSNPTIADNKTSDGTGTGTFTSALTGLTAGTTYYVRAYATNYTGTTYGAVISFTTNAITLPTLTTTTISSITTTTALSGGVITNDGGVAITARGVCWSTSSNPTTSNNKTSDGTGNGVFSSSMTGLTAITTYYVRAYATNSIGTAYGSELSFTTSAITLPTLTTTTLSSITTTTASSGGTITNDGGATITARGVCWSTATNPTISNSKTSNGAGAGVFFSSITGLTASTTYYVRAFATNSFGTAYGNQVSFTTVSLSVGQSYQGGIIAYIFQSGDAGYIAGQTHGIIAASSDQSTGIYWLSMGNINKTTNATGSEIGSGLTNTNQIVSSTGTEANAAKLCYDLSLNGYSDWHLPSQAELGKLYLNRTLIGGFSIAKYWSSTESSYYFAYYVNFADGILIDIDKKEYSYRVRAIRYF